MSLRIASWVQKSLVSGSPQFTRTAPIEVEPSPQFFGDVTIRAPHTNPAGSGSRTIMAVLFEDESGAVVDNAHPRAGDIPWSWTTSVGGGRWFSYIHTDNSTRAITVPQGLRLSLVGLYGWDDSSTARTVGAFTVEGNAMAEAQVARYARPDGTLATIGEARVWDGQWRTIYTSWQPRVVTLRNPGGTGALWQYISGDFGLLTITYNRGPGQERIEFNVPVTATHPVGLISVAQFQPGEIIPAGQALRGSFSTAGDITFTEART